MWRRRRSSAYRNTLELGESGSRFKLLMKMKITKDLKWSIEEHQRRQEREGKVHHRHEHAETGQ